MKDMHCRPCIAVNELVPLSEFRDLKGEKKAILVRKIKTLIIDLISSSGEQLEVNFSQYLTTKLNYEYAYLSVLFSKDQGITIERFMIEQKIDRIKYFLLKDQLTITRIALNMNYSSVGHLSNQFKKITGFSPTQFKKRHHQVEGQPLPVPTS